MGWRSSFVWRGRRPGRAWAHAQRGGVGSLSIEVEGLNLAPGGFGLAGGAEQIRASSPPEIGGRPVHAAGSCGPDVAAWGDDMAPRRCSAWTVNVML